MRREYLWNNIKKKKGAYGCNASFTRNGDVMFTSYRDPNLGKTNQVYLKAADFIENFKRYYPKGDFASYVLGYAKEVVNTNDSGEEETTMIGEMGIEKYYDSTLKGEDGYTTYQKDLRG